ncbi:preprotein translocase subunit SecA [bacterium]|nr:preprotein translocase subunit SecA [bacterium]
MLSKIFSSIFGSKYDRDTKKLKPVVSEINSIYPTLQNLSQAELQAKTFAFREKIQTIYNEAKETFIKDGLDSETVKKKLKEIDREILDEILPEAFAMVKETCRRLYGQKWLVSGLETEWNMIPFDVQLMGGISLHQGKIAEMATGEGKTLVATMPVFLNALTGRGVHVITVNDYLAQRDSEWMGKIYEYLGLTCSYLINSMDSEQRREVYKNDILYGTNNEFGFDYLRDNMAWRIEDTVQRGHNFAVIDEVDSVLIDEARTPLIISGPVDVSGHQTYVEMRERVEKLVKIQNELVNEFISQGEEALKTEENKAGIFLLTALRGAPKNKRLAKLMNETGVKKIITSVENDFMRDKKMSEIDEQLYFSIDEKSHVIDLTEKGRITISPEDPDAFLIPDVGAEIAEIDNNQELTKDEKLKQKTTLQELANNRGEIIHAISQLLRAFSLYQKDVEYVVQDGKVQIVDEFTGRVLVGRRYSDGLHQAIEAKENVAVEKETQTYATITLQNYYRLYSKLAGMTGTAETEESEFFEIYKLPVTVIPTNKPMTRKDENDYIFKTKREKYNAILKEIQTLHEKGVPVLVGTVSVDVSETLSRMLKSMKIPHNVLNAKQHAKEAEVVTGAGKSGAVTIATNMAGRGTDIKLGAGITELGGLHIIGTERHDSRRIDRQLRGRAGRQGDPGFTRFYLSLEDDLMRLFGSDRIAAIMDKLGAEEGEVITHPIVTKSIGRAQKKVETNNFSIRKHLLEYDDVMNQQRQVIYKKRRQILEEGKLGNEIYNIVQEYANILVEEYTDEKKPCSDWDWISISERLKRDLHIDFTFEKSFTQKITVEETETKLIEIITQNYKHKREILGEEMLNRVEHYVALRVIDQRWKEHLYQMDQLRGGINLRAYGQKDPLLEYKGESYKLFIALLDKITLETLGMVFRVQIQTEQENPPPQPKLVQSHQTAENHSLRQDETENSIRTAKVPVKVEKVPGRNEPCWCGSGKKYKNCHGNEA